MVLLPDEETDEHQAFVEALVGELQPAGEMEAVLVDRIVTTAWRLRRVARVEAGLFVRNHYDLLTKLTRYETSLERSLYRALHELQRLQAARAGGMVVPPVAVDVNVEASHDAT